jgi:radical SAM superfamily enzyme
MIATSEHLSSLAVDGVKFHNLVIPAGTEMHRQFRAGRVDAPSPEQHLNSLIASLEHTCKKDGSDAAHL